LETFIDWLPIVASLLASGIFAGILAGLLGAGGGLIIVPVLYLLFQYAGISASTAMLVATGTSLATMIPTSMSSTFAHHRAGNVDLKLLKLWLLPMLTAVLIGGVIAIRTDGTVLTLIFGLVVILSALNMLFRANAPAIWKSLPSKPIQIGLGGIIGFVSVIMGIGGATLGIPIMTAFNMPTHRAIGTAAMFGLVIALPGALFMLLQGFTPTDAPLGTVGLVNFPALLIIVPMTAAFAPLGVKIGGRFDGPTLKKFFVIFLFIIGARMLWQVL